MTAADIDVQAIALPEAVYRGLTKLMARLTGLDAKFVLVARHIMFGEGTPTYGQVRRLTVGDLQLAFGRAVGDDGVPLAALRELAEILPRLAPDVPVCSACGDLPLANTGGRLSALPAGSACPFCPAGQLELVPVLLRRLAWTSGRLVEPSTTHDLRTEPGERLPLLDEDIRAWVGWLSPGLERALAEAAVPLYGFLAYERFYRRAYDRVADAKALLQHPENFGLTAPEDLTDAVRSAAAFLTQREVTNLPRQQRRGPVDRRLSDTPRVTIAGQPYLIEGRVGRGGHADVYRARWDHEPAATVIIKVGHLDTDAAALRDEANVLRQLGRSEVRGADFFTRLIPEVIATGEIPDEANGTSRPATVFRYKNLFDWTLEDARQEYPEGLAPEHAVWMGNRVFLLLGWVHLNGVSHGNIRPEHILIHPLNHAATLLGWSSAAVTKAAFNPEADIAAAAKCLIYVLGGDHVAGALPGHIPEPLADFLLAHAGFLTEQPGRRSSDALQVEKSLRAVARQVFGPPQYHPFHLPRRS